MQTAHEKKKLFVQCHVKLCLSPSEQYVHCAGVVRNYNYSCSFPVSGPCLGDIWNSDEVDVDSCQTSKCRVAYGYVILLRGIKRGKIPQIS